MSWSSPITKIKAARRKHRCDWCADEIMPTMPYHKWAWVDEGKICTTKVHPECDEAIWEFQEAAPGESWEPYRNNRGCSCFQDPDCDNCYGPFDETENPNKTWADSFNSPFVVPKM